MEKKYDIIELLSASATTQSVILDALIEQGIIDKPALIKYLTAVIEAQHPEPTKPSLQLFLRGIVKHLEGKATLGSKLLQ